MVIKIYPKEKDSKKVEQKELGDSLDISSEPARSHHDCFDDFDRGNYSRDYINNLFREVDVQRGSILESFNGLRAELLDILKNPKNALFKEYETCNDERSKLVNTLESRISRMQGQIDDPNYDNIRLKELQRQIEEKQRCLNSLDTDISKKRAQANELLLAQFDLANLSFPSDFVSSKEIPFPEEWMCKYKRGSRSIARNLFDEWNEELGNGDLKERYEKQMQEIIELNIRLQAALNDAKNEKMKLQKDRKRVQLKSKNIDVVCKEMQSSILKGFEDLENAKRALQTEMRKFNVRKNKLIVREKRLKMEADEFSIVKNRMLAERKDQQLELQKKWEEVNKM